MPPSDVFSAAVAPSVAGWPPLRRHECGTLAPGSLLHERTGENEFIQLHNHLIDLCGWGLHLGLLSLDAACFPMNSETPVQTGWPRNSASSRRLKPRKMRVLPVKLNQKIPFHLFCHWNVPAVTPSTLLLPSPYPSPFISDAQALRPMRIEKRTLGDDSLLTKRFEQKDLVKEVSVDRTMTTGALLPYMKSLADLPTRVIESID